MRKILNQGAGGAHQPTEKDEPVSNQEAIARLLGSLPEAAQEEIIHDTMTPRLVVHTSNDRSSEDRNNPVSCGPTRQHSRSGRRIDGSKKEPG
jgi:hypothetical protein